MLCDIRDGKLIDMGKDALQEPSSSSRASSSDAGDTTSVTDSMEGGFDDGTDKQDSGTVPAAKVLGLAVGLLGLDVHEAPNPWAEAWLSFEDATRKHLGLGGRLADIEGPSAVKLREEMPRRKRYMEEQSDWQMRVLSHLRNLVTRGKVHPPVLEDGGQVQVLGEAAAKNHGLLGPDFKEHLDTAEFILKRITSAVVCLQDPSRQERPMLLKEYTEENAAAVCKDLRQWIEQLSNLLSLYHVHLLDLETERRRLERQLESQQAKFAKGEEERLSAVHRYAKLDEIRKEDQMKRRAEALLGITLDEEDPKIYSQRDMDDMFAKWQKEKVDPLLAEIKELRSELKSKGERNPRAGGDDEQEEAVKSMKLAAICLKNLADRTTQSDVADIQRRIATAISGNGRELADILKDINKLPSAEELNKPVAAPPKSNGAEESAAACLKAVSTELSKLERGLKDVPGLESVSALAGWARDCVDAAKGAKKEITWKPAPGWQVNDIMNALSAAKGAKGKSEGADDQSGVAECLGVVSTELTKFLRALKNVPGGAKAAAFMEWARDTVNTAKVTSDPRWRVAPAWDLDGLGGGSAGVDNSGDLEAMWQARLDKLRSEYEEKLRRLMEQLEEEKQKTADALRRLAEETKRADDMMNQLRRKLQDMQALLKKAGLGQQAEDAIWEAGLAEFLNGRDVFERLYRDALSRMRRLAEAQMKMLEESSDTFIRNVQHLYSPFVGQERMELSVPGQRPGPVFRGPSPAERHAAISPLYGKGLDINGGDDPRSPPPGLQVARLSGPGSAPPGRVIFPAPQSPPPPTSARQDEGRYPSPPSQRMPLKQLHGGSRGSASTPDLAIVGGGQNVGPSRHSPEGGPRHPQPLHRLARGIPSAGAEAQGGGVLPPLGGLRGCGVPGPGGTTTAATADGCARDSAARSRSPQTSPDRALLSPAHGLGLGAGLAHAPSAGIAGGAHRGRRQSGGGSHLLPQSFAAEGFRISSAAGPSGPPASAPPARQPAALHAAGGKATVRSAMAATHRGPAQLRPANGGTSSMPSLGPRMLVHGLS